ncbi:CYTH domain-containing protein [Clostridium tagluense]|uniref:CYTH domain-containing protein n=1 Tax=Clostridium tagluense TaxID=360422 RepID=A0A401UTP8_9CLOT|nr:CYTH domain-containing protein [Clostridium tagluense]GCD12917.1 hypothetical protein Ctaglu_45400 [Clostridium tagluense]
MEIERKFLVKEIPSNLNKYVKEPIAQDYLSFKPEVRLRTRNDKCYLTVKGEGVFEREEYETEIKKETYLDLLKKSQGKPIQKDRYIIPLYDGLIAELDLYKNIEWLKETVEVEFKDIESARGFKVPLWFGLEVTGRAEYKNKNLAKEYTVHRL